MIPVVHPDPDFLLIPDPGVKKASDSGSGSATLPTAKCYLSADGAVANHKHSMIQSVYGSGKGCSSHPLLYFYN